MNENMEQEEEIWRDIPGREGRDQVSNLGRIRSFYDRSGRHRLEEPRVCNLYLRHNYRMKRVGKKMRDVHKIVAEVFIPNPEGKPQVDHINTVTTDNRVSNLRWVTPKENQENPITKARWEAVSQKPVEQLTPDCQTVIARFASARAAERAIGCQNSHIIECCRGILKTHHGYAWRYADVAEQQPPR